jgi:hypothetical protein
MGKDKDKWAELVKYLNTTDAKPEKVLNLVKQSFKTKGIKTVKTDDFNIIRRAWTLLTVAGIYKKQGTPKNKLKTVTITNQILYYVESEAYKINYAMFHPVKTKNKKLKITEWNTSTEDLYSKKSLTQHAKNCRKLWDSPKGKELRKHLPRTKGQIPITYKGELNSLFDL